MGKVINQYKMAKHFELTLTDDSFTYRRKAESIAAEAALDGLYVMRTSLGEDALNAADTVRAYKRLSTVERAFRSLKERGSESAPGVSLHRPPVCAPHVLLCMLAYYVEWHMRQRLKPLLFDDEDPGVAQAARRSVVAPARVSDSARAKARRQHTAEGVSGTQLPHPAR